MSSNDTFALVLFQNKEVDLKKLKHQTDNFQIHGMQLIIKKIDL